MLAVCCASLHTGCCHSTVVVVTVFNDRHKCCHCFSKMLCIVMLLDSVLASSRYSSTALETKASCSAVFIFGIKNQNIHTAVQVIVPVVFYKCYLLIETEID